MRGNKPAHLCCTPARASPFHLNEPRSAEPRNFTLDTETVTITGGVFQMGGSDPDGFPHDGEGPVRDVHTDTFQMDVCAVSAEQFAEFVSATGYITDAERFGWSFVFASAVQPNAVGSIIEGSVPQSPWWLAVKGANWRNPEGRGSDWRDKPDHPVVHVSWNDAVAFAKAVGKRLPTEAEWEKAARGGLVNQRFPWGNDLEPGGKHRCNIWQGDFPAENLGTDGYLTTAPVRAYEPNGYGLYNVIGNVWEWCLDGWSVDWHRSQTDATRLDPRGPDNEMAKVIRGGSYLCHSSYCNRYRLSARSFNTPDSSAGNTGFRCAC